MPLNPNGQKRPLRRTFLHPNPSAEPPDQGHITGDRSETSLHSRCAEPAVSLAHALTANCTQRRWPILLAFATVGISAWGLFLAWSENQERLSSSVMRQVMDIVRDSPELKEVLGEAIRPEPVWWLNGDPWITGSVRVNAAQRESRP